MYACGQDDLSVQPIYQLYLPLLVSGSGIGGVGSSEGLAEKQAEVQTRFEIHTSRDPIRLRLLFLRGRAL